MPRTITVSHKFIHSAPRKLRLICDMIRGLPAQRAEAELLLLKQFASQTIRQVIISSIAAAKEAGLDENKLFVKSIMVNEGPKLRRFITMSRGRSQRILKRMSHLVVSLIDEPITIASGRAYKKELAKAIVVKSSEGSK